MHLHHGCALKNREPREDRGGHGVVHGALRVEELHITDAADANAVHEEDVPVVVGTARFPGRLTRSRPRNGWIGAARGAAMPIRMD